MKDWRSVAILVLVAILMDRESAHTSPPPHAGYETAPVDPRTPIPVQIIAPVPVILVAPVNPNSDPHPRPQPPSPEPRTSDTPLSLVGRDYLQQITTALPDVWLDLANKIDSGEITDKAGAVALHNSPSASLNTMLNNLFAPNIDAKGKITNKSAITNMLRRSASALGSH